MLNAGKGEGRLLVYDHIGHVYYQEPNRVATQSCNSSIKKHFNICPEKAEICLHIEDDGKASSSRMFTTFGVSAIGTSQALTNTKLFV
jgi:hypothetical protein